MFLYRLYPERGVVALYLACSHRVEESQELFVHRATTGNVTSLHPGPTRIEPLCSRSSSVVKSCLLAFRGNKKVITPLYIPGSDFRKLGIEPRVTRYSRTSSTLLSGVCMSRSTEDDDHYDVIVIGAGPSGISAAARLVEEVNLSASRPLC